MISYERRGWRKLPTLAVIVTTLFVAGCSKPSDEPVAAALPAAAGKPAGAPKLVDLGATACVPCKMMAPILEELESQYVGVLDVEFIDVWQPENKDIAKSYGVEEIPTQIFLDPEGKELWRHVGFISKEDILAKWNEFGYDLKPVDGVASEEAP